MDIVTGRVAFKFIDSRHIAFKCTGRAESVLGDASGGIGAVDAVVMTGDRAIVMVSIQSQVDIVGVLACITWHSAFKFTNFGHNAFKVVTKPRWFSLAAIFLYH